jgi:hypothetical protein
VVYIFYFPRYKKSAKNAATLVWITYIFTEIWTKIEGCINFERQVANLAHQSVGHSHILRLTAMPSYAQ